MKMHRASFWPAWVVLTLANTGLPQRQVFAEPGKEGVSPKLSSMPSAASTIEFSGRHWRVKDSYGNQVGPGPCYFSSDCVRVDSAGRLHLQLIQRDGCWFCGEVISMDNFGHGTYRWHLDTAPARIDRNVVLGLFTWDASDPSYNYREIDIEVSRWGQ